MNKKTIYLPANDKGWSLAVSITIDPNDPTQATETTTVRWSLQAKTPAGELWTSNRGERATSLEPLLNPERFFEKESKP